MELTIKQLLQQAIAAHKEGNLQAAERLYRAILQSQPSHPDANHNLGVLAVSVNKTNEALPLFKTAAEANPKLEQFWLSYIDALIKEKRFDNAKQVIEQAKKQFVVAEKFNALERQLASINEEEKIGSLSPSQQQLNNLIEYYQTGQYGDAETLALSITQEFPKHQFGWKVLGAILKQTGRAMDSLTAMQKSMQLAPQDAEAHSNLGVTLQELGKFDEALASYTQAIALKPDLAEAHFNLGVMLQELEKFDEALASYTQAIALKPDYASAHSNLGVTLQELGKFDEALASYKQAIALNSNLAEAHKNLAMVLIMKGLTESALQHLQINFELERGAKPVKPRHKSFTNTSKAKIDHDIEQFEYLAASGYDIKKFSELAAVYKIVSSEIDCVSDTDIVPLSDKHLSLLGDTFNRSIHMLEAPALEGSTIGDGFDVNKITENYFEHEFGLTYVDELLSPTALKSLRDFLLGSTIWYDFFHNGGYIGAYLSEGLASPLVLQIAEDLRKKFPKIFKNHQLTQLWAYKYDSRASKKNNSFKGINVHADFAAINVNFWITPKAANLDKSSGGLVVYNTEAPLEWDFKIFNRNDEKILEEISKQGGKKDIIPYNDNRAVIFNSNLFHETDTIDFKDGYENRRINVTILFGRREENHE